MANKLEKMNIKDTTCNCCLCGEHIDREYRTLEHIIPTAIVKWVNTLDVDIRKEEIGIIIHDVKNLSVSHPLCNRLKGSIVYSIEDMKHKYNLTDDKIDSVKEVYNQLEIVISKYNKLCKDVLAKQDNKCFICRDKITDGAIIRRIDNTIPRSKDNCCIVCPICSMHLIRKKYPVSIDDFVKSVIIFDSAMDRYYFKTYGKIYNHYSRLNSL